MLRRSLVCLLLALLPSTALAVEPLTMFLLGLLRDRIASSMQDAIENAPRSEQPSAPAAIPPSPYDLDDGKLRTLIDEGFPYLSSAQRDEVFASVKRMLSDPKNAASKPAIVQELAIKAAAVRQAQERLANLSGAEKRSIAEQARGEYEKLPPEQRRQMMQVLQSGTVPIPHDLSEMILAEFSSVPAAAAPRGR